MTIDDKLLRGYALLRRAGNDESMLGLAMITFHGALEDHLDEMLRRDPDLDPQIREALENGRLGWLPRADAALARGLITPTQRNIALDANRLRQEVAHGETFAGSAASVEQYATFVSGITGRGKSVRAVREAAEAPTAAHSAVGSNAYSARRARPRPAASRPVVSMLPWPVRNMAFTAVAVVVGVGLLWWMLGGIINPTNTPATNTARPPTTAPLPTPAPQLATIARLGGATGLMRTAPSFNAPTQPAPISDGTRVTILNRPTVQAEGTSWRYISYGGYDGWVPEHNLDIQAPTGVG
jgi:hypothetical protein